MRAGRRKRGFVVRSAAGLGKDMRRRTQLLILTLVAALLILSGVAHAKKKPPAHPIDINIATVKELEELPGVGPTTAKAIVEFRTRAGRFQHITDLLVIRGISESKLKKMRPYITLDPPPKKSVPSAKPATAPPAAQTQSSPANH
jgi:competence ComEA-like helix-hairpin-helix protein